MVLREQAANFFGYLIQFPRHGAGPYRRVPTRQIHVTATTCFPLDATWPTGGCTWWFCPPAHPEQNRFVTILHLVALYRCRFYELG